MFASWLETHDLNDYTFSSFLLPDSSDRAFWEAHQLPDLIENAEQYLNYRWPLILAADFMAFKHEGIRRQQEKPYFERRRILLRLILAEVQEHQGRFLPDVVNGLMLICEETFWGLSAHWPGEPGNIPDHKHPYIDLFAAETSSTVTLAYTLLKDELKDFCPELLTRIEDEVERRILTPYLEHRDFWWMGYGHGVNNWNPWILCNVLQSFLLMEKDEQRKREAVQKTMTEIEAFYRCYPMDGACDEGPNYWTVAANTMAQFCMLLHRATNGAIDFFGDEKMRNMGEYEYHAYIGDGRFINFCDCPATNPVLCGCVYAYGKWIGSEKMMGMAGELAKRWSIKNESDEAEHLRYLLFNMLYWQEMKEQKWQREPEFLLPDTKIAAKRSGEWYFAAKGGHNNEGHNHNDVGSFMLFYQDQPVLIDPGCGFYNKKTFSAQRYEIWTMQSGWHNLPVVNGQMQPDGRNFRSSRFDLTEDGTACEFAGAYKPEAGVEKLERAIQYTENGIRVTDDFTFTGEENTAEEHLMTNRPVTIKNGKAYLEGGFVIEADGAGFETDTMDISYDERLHGQWQADYLTRLRFTQKFGRNGKMIYTVKKI